MHIELIDDYIHELLQTHNCVIIPNFGGFVCNYKPAKLINNIWQPPYKQVAFNEKLNTNDGLLASHIAINEKLPYNHALDSITLFVDNLKSSLYNNKKTEIEKVGAFTLSATGEVLFEDKSIDLLPETYGLSKINVLPLNNEAIHTAIERQIKQQKQKNQQKTKIRKFNTKVIVPTTAAAAALALVVSLNISPIKSQFRNYSSYFFNTSQNTVYNPNNQLLNFDKDFQLIDNKEDTLFFEWLKNKVKKQNTPIGKEQLTIELAKKYFIIGGCFSKQTNAEDFVKTLLEKGYNAGILDKKINNLIPVYYEGYANITEANSKMENIKINENSNIWLHKSE